jgi:hypothetical protein
MIPQDERFIMHAIGDGQYVVLAKPVNLDVLNQRQQNDAEAIYGGAFADPRLVDKTTLHPAVDGSPIYASISAEFQQQIAGLVLPGYSVLCEADVHFAFELLAKQGITTVRLKDAVASDGKLQFVVSSAAEAVAVYRQSGMQAAVLEQQLEAKEGLFVKNISVGTVHLPNIGQFMVVSRQIDLQRSNGQTMYGGADCIVVRGGAEVLLENSEAIAANLGEDSGLIFQTVANASQFMSAFIREHECVISRLTVDTLESMICDISCRVTGSDPFMQLAIESLLAQQDAKFASGFVHLNYDAAGFEDTSRGETFVYHKAPNFPDHDLQIIAGINQLIY